MINSDFFRTFFRILLLSLAVFALAMAIAVLFPETQEHGVGSAFRLGSKELLTALLVAAAVEFVSHAFEAWRRWSLRARFRQFFDVRPGRVMCIVVPELRSEGIGKAASLQPPNGDNDEMRLMLEKVANCGADAPRFARTNVVQAPRLGASLGDAAFGDLCATASIVQLFSRANLPIPLICSDKGWKEPKTPAFTAFAVGFWTNALTEWAAHKMGTNISKAMFAAFRPDNPQATSSVVVVKTEKAANWKDAHAEYQVDFAPASQQVLLIAKVKGIQERTVLICAGMTEEGSRAAGQFLLDHWRDLYDYRTQSGGKVGSQPFAATVRAKLDSNGALESWSITCVYVPTIRTFDLRSQATDMMASATDAEL